MSAASRLGETLKNRFRSGGKSDVSDNPGTDNKSASGGSTAEANPNTQANIAQANIDDHACFKCEKTWENVSPKNKSVQCCHCPNW